jgi:conjugative transposon TraM protein
VKIDFKKPKYILPLIALPFLFLFYFIIGTWNNGSKKQAEQVTKDSLANLKVDQINPDMPDVSKDVADASIKNKFQSLKEAYKYDQDYSALTSIGGKEGEKGLKDSSLGSAYTDEDIEKLRADRSLDSLKKTIENNKRMLDNGMHQMLSKNNSNSSKAYNQPKDAQAIMEELKQMQQKNNTASTSNYNEAPSTTTDRMQMFREQMRLVDSLQKATNAATTTAQKNTQGKNNIDPSADSTFKPLHVSLAKKTTSGFNTVRSFNPDESIRAIIDQDEKVYAGTRIRIRLLDDINVGENVIPKGSYIYGVISGFQSQRVNVSIAEIMYQNTPLPVALDVFDNDGYLGLYVPGSNFREFSKEIGTQGTSGLSSVEVGSGDLASSLAGKLFETTGSSVNKLIKKDKAFLKYNYIIYLKERKK